MVGNLKRKFDSEDAEYSTAKQLKLNFVPFPNYDNDVAMSDAAHEEPHHIRLPSSASSVSSSEYSPDAFAPLNALVQYPDSIHPFSFVVNQIQSGAHEMDDCNRPLDNFPLPSVPESIGLVQLTKSSTFTHNGNNCTQIPKLRVACAAGVNGVRTMWSHCEQCGAIEMVAS